LPSLELDERHLGAGDEAGTAPEDRRFRPDVEGLRAVAVLLVVLYHADVPRVTGGFVGVDVFFVISGFVITGVLLRERRGTGRTSIVSFYARRVRRILPAATLVILVVVVASYVVLGYVSGDIVANDGRWAAVFLSNFHFEATGTNYFTAKLPPSPLQNFWSLSVEEQFYLVYPTLFLVMARLKSRWSLRAKMAISLVVVIGVSYWLSVVQTASQPTSAYFSPFTRAWELALGALIAVGTPCLKRIPALGAALLTWAGLAAIAAAALTFTAQTTYPGSLVAIPVVGAALVIAGGVVAPRAGAEQLLGLGPFQWFGKRSYALYLWHWPILIIAAEQAGKTALPLRENLALVLFAVAISMASYAIVENPVRHWKVPSTITVAAGVAAVLATVAILSLIIETETTWSAGPEVPAAPTLQAVVHQVAEARSITEVPASIDPGLAQAASDWGGAVEGAGCASGITQSTEHLCFLGDVHARRLLIVYGDSHALMWLPAFDFIARNAHMRLLVLGKTNCPASLVTVGGPPGTGPSGSPFVACDRWHNWALRTINRLSPSMLVVSQASYYLAPEFKEFTAAQWRSGLTNLFDEVRTPHTEKVLLGNIPWLSQSGPSCLSTHLDDALACSTPVTQAYERLDQTEFSVAESLHIRYIDPTPWFCSNVCTAVIGPYDVYMDQVHVSATYAAYLRKVLAQALLSPIPTPTHFVQADSTGVVQPSSGATLSGDSLFDAIAVLGSSSVEKVDFQLSGGRLHNQTICAGSQSLFGWFCRWNSSTVANGRYTLRVIASYESGEIRQSKPISLSVKN
jgi:peptidoglycan/LPS O-acetylase OafA/YrhL